MSDAKIEAEYLLLVRMSRRELEQAQGDFARLESVVPVALGPALHKVRVAVDALLRASEGEPE